MVIFVPDQNTSTFSNNWSLYYKRGPGNWISSGMGLDDMTNTP